MKHCCRDKNNAKVSVWSVADPSQQNWGAVRWVAMYQGPELGASKSETEGWEGIFVIKGYLKSQNLNSEVLALSHVTVLVF